MLKTAELEPAARAGHDDARDGSGPPSGFVSFVVLLGLVGAVALFVLSLYGNSSRVERTPSRMLTAKCPIPTAHDPAVIRTVYEVGVRRRASEKVLLAAFEAGWVESHMRNLTCGDRDSVGVFQQRPSQGWGTVAQVGNVRYAATMFFVTAERAVSSHPDDTAGQIAQRVQRSAYPERYDEAENKARELLTEARRLASAGRR